MVSPLVRTVTGQDEGEVRVFADRCLNACWVTSGLGMCRVGKLVLKKGKQTFSPKFDDEKQALVGIEPTTSVLLGQRSNH